MLAIDGAHLILTGCNLTKIAEEWAKWQPCIRERCQLAERASGAREQILLEVKFSEVTARSCSSSESHLSTGAQTEVQSPNSSRSYSGTEFFTGTGDGYIQSYFNDLLNVFLFRRTLPG